MCRHPFKCTECLYGVLPSCPPAVFPLIVHEAVHLEGPLPELLGPHEVHPSLGAGTGYTQVAFSLRAADAVVCYAHGGGVLVDAACGLGRRFGRRGNLLPRLSPAIFRNVVSRVAQSLNDLFLTSILNYSDVLCDAWGWCV